ncbi:hypothetical protein Dip510_000342 [Elusimicrobium posterum]|uniref:hypothetical protein n=1 Tax=Elusimicrobium posterum TaxID=3116653 RepID=UPI003C774C68
MWKFMGFAHSIYFILLNLFMILFLPQKSIQKALPRFFLRFASVVLTPLMRLYLIKAAKLPQALSRRALKKRRFLGFLTTRIKTVEEKQQPYQFLYSNMTKTTPQNTNRFVLRKGASNGKNQRHFITALILPLASIAAFTLAFLLLRKIHPLPVRARNFIEACG